LYNWPWLFLISIAGSIIGTYSAPPTDQETLESFYKTVKPWGFWKPIKEAVMAKDPTFKANNRFKLDMFNVVLGIIAQLCLTIVPMYLVLGMQQPLWICLLVLGIIVLILKRTWWNQLED